jgi:uncharacterized membrane protein YfcA
LPVTVPTAIAGAYNYWRKGLIRKDIVLWAALGGLPGVFIGALGTKVISGQWLMIMTGVFVSFSGLQLIRRKKEVGGDIFLPRRYGGVMMLLIGFVVGIFSGLLANGGGFLLIPVFILLLDLSPHEAVGTSLVCVALYAIPGTLVHWWLGHIDWPLVLGLSIGVIPASYLGSKLGLAVREQRIGTAFGYFLTIFGLDFILTQFGLNPIITYSILMAAIVGTIGWVAIGVREERDTFKPQS